MKMEGHSVDRDLVTLGESAKTGTSANKIVSAASARSDFVHLLYQSIYLFCCGDMTF